MRFCTGLDGAGFSAPTRQHMLQIPRVRVQIGNVSALKGLLLIDSRTSMLLCPGWDRLPRVRRSKRQVITGLPSVSVCGMTDRVIYSCTST